MASHSIVSDAGHRTGRYHCSKPHLQKFVVRWHIYCFLHTRLHQDAVRTQIPQPSTTSYFNVSLPRDSMQRSIGLLVIGRFKLNTGQGNMFGSFAILRTLPVHDCAPVPPHVEDVGEILRTNTET